MYTIRIIVLVILSFFGASNTLYSMENQLSDNQSLNNQLIQAVKNGNKKIVETLLKKDININVQDEHGNTPLMLALFRFYDDIAILLINNNADIFIKNKQNNYAFREIISASHPQAVEAILNKYSDIDLEITDAYGQTPLMWTNRGGCEKTVKLLLKRNVNIDIIDKNGDTALSLAIKTGRKEITRLLLEHEILLKKNFNDQIHQDAFILMVNSCWYDLAELLLKNGFDSNTRYQFGTTPLILFCSYWNHPKMLTMLLKYGANVNATSNCGDSILVEAIRHNINLKAVEILLNAENIEINQQDREGDTPLMFAIKAKASLWRHNEYLHMYSEEELMERKNKYNNIIYLLISKESNLAIKNRMGETAWTLALQNQDNDTIELLQNRLIKSKL